VSGWAPQGRRGKGLLSLGWTLNFQVPLDPPSLSSPPHLYHSSEQETAHQPGICTLILVAAWPPPGSQAHG
jgi:hypothetical protein